MEDPRRGRSHARRRRPDHAAGVLGIISEARARDEVMHYVVNLTADASTG